MQVSHVGPSLHPLQFDSILQFSHVVFAKLKKITRTLKIVEAFFKKLLLNVLRI